MTSNLGLSHSKLRIRVAVLSLFLAQGLCFASWASRLPDIKNQFSADSFLFYSFLMFLIPVGKFFAIPIIGFLIPRLGSKKTVLISILGFAFALMLVGSLHNIYIVGTVMLLFGTFWNMTDISLNTQAIEVERIYGKPIIATFHATWSLAACIGALIGYIMINMQVNTFSHFIVMGVFAFVLISINYPCLLESISNEDKELVDTIGTDKQVEKKKGFALPEAILLILGSVWLLALIVENTMFEWSDLYFQSVIQAPSSMQIGFLVFMTMMFVGRLLTNTAYTFMKKKTVLQVAGTLIFIGFATSSILINHVDSISTKVAINSIGFMLIGLGISCIVPTIYSIVAEKATTPVGLALTIMSGISFVGPLVAPLLVGFTSEHFSMKAAYFLIGIIGAIIALIATFSKSLR